MEGEGVEVVGAKVVEEEDPGFRVDLQVDIQAHLQVDLQEDLLLHQQVSHTTRHLLSTGQFQQQKPSMF